MLKLLLLVIAVAYAQQVIFSLQGPVFASFAVLSTVNQTFTINGSFTVTGGCVYPIVITLSPGFPLDLGPQTYSPVSVTPACALGTIATGCRYNADPGVITVTYNVTVPCPVTCGVNQCGAQFSGGILSSCGSNTLVGTSITALAEPCQGNEWSGLKLKIIFILLNVSSFFEHPGYVVPTCKRRVPNCIQRLVYHFEHQCQSKSLKTLLYILQACC